MQNENNEAIHNLIESIQTKLNNNEQVNQNEQSEYNNTQEPENSKQNNLDSLLNNNNIIQMLSNFSTGTKKENNTSGFGDIDPNMLFKIQKLISSMNEDDPKKNLLLSLKPFLRKSRQDKLNEYMTMLTVIKALEVFGSKGSD